MRNPIGTDRFDSTYLRTLPKQLHLPEFSNMLNLSNILPRFGICESPSGPNSCPATDDVLGSLRKMSNALSIA